MTYWCYHLLFKNVRTIVMNIDLLVWQSQILPQLNHLFLRWQILVQFLDGHSGFRCKDRKARTPPSPRNCPGKESQKYNSETFNTIRQIIWRKWKVCNRLPLHQRAECANLRVQVPAKYLLSQDQVRAINHLCKFKNYIHQSSYIWLKAILRKIIYLK